MKLNKAMSIRPVMPLIFKHYGTSEILLPLETVITDIWDTLSAKFPNGNIPEKPHNPSSRDGASGCQYCKGTGVIRNPRTGKQDWCICTEATAFEPWEQYLLTHIKLRETLNRIEDAILHSNSFSSIKDFFSQNGNKGRYEQGLDFARTGFKQGNWMLAIGPSRVGKTILAFSCAVYGFYHYGWDIHFYSAEDVILKMRQYPEYPPTTDPDSESQSKEGEKPIRCRADFFEHLAKVTCLVLDDLGIETDPENNSPILAALIAKRRASENPTIITTNLTVKLLEAKYGYRTNRRILEMTDENRYVFTFEK